MATILPVITILIVLLNNARHSFAYVMTPQESTATSETYRPSIKCQIICTKPLCTVDASSQGLVNIVIDASQSETFVLNCPDCRGGNITAGGSLHTIITCSEKWSCQEVSFTLDNSLNIDMNCGALKACYGASLSAINAANVSIVCNDESSCSHLNLVCPINDNTLCDISCTNYFFSCSSMQVHLADATKVDFAKVDCGTSNSRRSCGGTNYACGSDGTSSTLVYNNKWSCDSTDCCPFPITDAPTKDPTTTRSPTLKPTTNPTRRPTRGPTMQPSSTTRSPTIKPSFAPITDMQESTRLPSKLHDPATAPTLQESKSPSSPYTTEIFIISVAILIILVAVCFGLLCGIRSRNKRKQTYAMDSQVFDPVEQPSHRVIQENESSNELSVQGDALTIEGHQAEGEQFHLEDDSMIAKSVYDEEKAKWEKRNEELQKRINAMQKSEMVTIQQQDHGHKEPIEKMESDDALVIAWMTNTVKLPHKYAQMFINEGYNMQAIQAIEDKNDLLDVGIKNAFHQAIILREINEIQNKNFAVKGLTTRE